MKSIVLAAGFAILFCGQDICAQPPDTLWTQTYGDTLNDYGMCVQQTIDGGYIVAGQIADADVYLIRTDSSGDTLWTKTFGGTSNDVAASVQQDPTDGSFIVAGFTMSFGAGGWDVYLIKTDSSGNTLWTQTYGGTANEVGYSVQQTIDGGFIVAGYTSSFGAGNSDIYLIKTDSNGDVLWTQTYGGTERERGHCVQQTTDGGYIIVGDTRSYGAGIDDIYLIKTDSDGTVHWTQTFGGSSMDHGWYVQQTTPDGGYIVSGRTWSFGAGSSDAYLIRVDSGGDTLWTQTYGDILGDAGYCVQQTIGGGFIIAGTSMSASSGVDNIYLIKTDSSGDTLWTETCGGTNTDQGTSVQQTSDGGYIVTGATRSYGAGGFDVWLVKLEPETGIEEEAEGGSPPVILQSIEPNPFSSDLSINLHIPEQVIVELSIFDLSGRLIEELVSDQIPAGTHTVMWSPSESLPNGCYLIELDACGYHTVVRCLKLN